jgi:small-conductance mechanosensitive channel
MKHSEAKGRMQMGEFAMVQVDGMLNARDVQAKLNIYNNRIAELTNGVRKQYELNILLEQQLNAIPEADEESKMAELRGQIATLQQELRTVKRMLRNPDDLKNRLLGELLNNIDGELHTKTRNILEEACALRMRYYESEYKVPEVEK